MVLPSLRLEKCKDFRNTVKVSKLGAPSIVCSRFFIIYIKCLLIVTEWGLVRFLRSGSIPDPLEQQVAVPSLSGGFPSQRLSIHRLFIEGDEQKVFAQQTGKQIDTVTHRL